MIKKFCDAYKEGLKEVTCWGTGNPLGEFLHVDDLALACFYVLENWNPSSNKAPKDKFSNKLNHLNIGSGQEISIRNLANLVAKTVNYKGQILYRTKVNDGTPRKILNINRIKSLGWEPKISLEEGISQAVIDYKNNYQNQKYFRFNTLINLFIKLIQCPINIFRYQSIVLFNCSSN